MYDIGHGVANSWTQLSDFHFLSFSYNSWPLIIYSFLLIWENVGSIFVFLINIQNFLFDSPNLM